MLYISCIYIMCNASSYGPVCMWDQKMTITVPADVLTPDGTRGAFQKRIWALKSKRS